MLWGKSLCQNIRWTLHLPTLIPVIQIALSGNYQGAVFILTSVKEGIFISMSTAARQAWLVSQLSNLSTSFKCTIQWHFSKRWASASWIHWRKQAQFSPLSLNVLLLSHSFLIIPVYGCLLELCNECMSKQIYHAPNFKWEESTEI